MYLDFPVILYFSKSTQVGHFSYQLAISQSIIHSPPPLPVVYINMQLGATFATCMWVDCLFLVMALVISSKYVDPSHYGG